MTIWIDADACPKVIKELCFKLAIRKKLTVILVANSYIAYPVSNFIRAVQVQSSINAADNYIASVVEPEDLVITADIELASHVLNRGSSAISPRGEVFKLQSIASRLASVQMSATLRDMGKYSVQAPLGDKDKQLFANALDRYVTSLKL